MSKINRSRTRKLLFQRLYARTFDTNCDDKDVFFDNFYNEIMTFGVDHKYFDDIYELVIEKEAILVEIIKKYDIKNTDKPIGLGHAIDLYAAWMFEDGNYFTEYLVDIDFLKKDLLESCQLELIETDLYENQFNMHSSFFKDNIYKFELFHIDTY